MAGSNPQEPRVESARLRAALAKSPLPAQPEYLNRIPVRNGNNLVLVPTAQVTTIIADGANLIISTLDGKTHSFSYRLKDLELHLDPAEFVRLGRGALANVNTISRIVAGPSATNRVIFDDGHELSMSRIQSRRLREVLLRVLR